MRGIRYVLGPAAVIQVVDASGRPLPGFDQDAADRARTLAGYLNATMPPLRAPGISGSGAGGGGR